MTHSTQQYVPNWRLPQTTLECAHGGDRLPLAASRR